MPHSYRSMVISAPVEQVWTAVRQFNGLPAWHPVIVSSSLDSGEEGQIGAVRRLTTPDGGVIVERLLLIDDAERRLTYTILESPFPAKNYVSTMHVVPITDSGDSFVEWSAQYDCQSDDEAQLETLFGDGVFGTGLGALRDHVTG